MFKILKIEKNLVKHNSKLLPNISFVKFDIWVETDSIKHLIDYFLKNNLSLRIDNNCLVFRIATVEEQSLISFQNNEKKLDKKELIQAALEFDKIVSDDLLFGIGYEKDAFSENGKNIRNQIRDELLKITNLDKYCTVDKDGWVHPRLCIYGVFVNKI